MINTANAINALNKLTPDSPKEAFVDFIFIHAPEVKTALMEHDRIAKENRILKNKLTMAEYYEVQELLRNDMADLKTECDKLVRALMIVATDQYFNDLSKHAASVVRTALAEK